MDYKPIAILSKHARDYCHERIRNAGISDTEHKICAFLSFHSDVHQEFIASALTLDKATVAKVLASLESRGMICRCPNIENRRKNTVCLTETGRKTVADIIGVYDEWFTQVACCLSDAEQQQFSDFCHRLLEQAQKLSEWPNPDAAIPLQNHKGERNHVKL